VFLPDFIESGGKFACKSGKINQPCSISIGGKTPCFRQILLNRAAILRASREKATRPQAIRLSS
jgi:hypothetical protein